MSAKAPVLFPAQVTQITDLGERLRLARLRRDLSAEVVAARARISRKTLSRLEQGNAAISLGVLARVMAVLMMDEDLRCLARDDALGRRLQDLKLPSRRRASRAPQTGDI